MKIILVIILFLNFLIINPMNSYAVYDDVRNNGFSNDRCDTGTIEFDPGTKNKDIDWQITNPTCIAFIAANGVLIFGASKLASYLCLQPHLALEVAASASSGVPLSPQMIKNNAQNAAKCTSLLASNGYQAAACCGSVAAQATAIGLGMASLAFIFGKAKYTYENSKICGWEWTKWRKTTDTQTKKETWIKQKGKYQTCLDGLFTGRELTDEEKKDGITIPCDGMKDGNRDISNKLYREFIYGGIEYEDGDGCENPKSWSDKTRKRILGYTTDNQRYYMTGPGNTPVYACGRFLAQPKDESDPIAARNSGKEAYECCKNRSQEAICIETTFGEFDLGKTVYRKFCKANSTCVIQTTTFEAYQSRKQSNYICARTYSYCPYNHNLAGGTEIEKFDEDNRRVNFCQFLNHCSKIPILPHINDSGLGGAFISSACRDLVGDSQNSYSYDAELLPISTKHFSAPMAQCFKETIENLFLNKAGRTICTDYAEQPSVDGTCISGYIQKKGEELKQKSFFRRIQDNLRIALTMGIIFSVMAIGLSIFFGVPKLNLDRKKIMSYVIKISLVSYFALEDGWHSKFAEGIMSSSSYLSYLTFRPDESVTNIKEGSVGFGNIKIQQNTPDLTRLDGCQFPRFNYAVYDQETKYQNPQYPKGKEYLRIWDTLDCKIARALGFGPEVSVPNLAIMILAGFLTGGLGIVFFIAAFIFAFFLISITIRALHIFVMCSLSVVLLLYISPITITLSLFEKTKGIFSQWLKQIIGFTFQPMILFAYLGILITLFDTFIIGEDARFEASKIKSTTTRNLSSSSETYDNYGRQSPKKIICNDKAKETSIYCIFSMFELGRINSLEPIGIMPAFLKSLNQEKLSTIIKSALILFIFTNFLEKISGFAVALVGGKEFKSDWNISAMSAAAKAFGALKGIQTRGMRALKSLGGKAAKAGLEKAKEFNARKMNTKIPDLEDSHSIQKKENQHSIQKSESGGEENKNSIQKSESGGEENKNSIQKSDPNKDQNNGNPA